jgi:uncharacterized protein with PIN domain
MLGKLARKLRILGFDTLYYSQISEEEVLEKSEGRILLTRDKELYRVASSKGFEVYYVDHDDWREQLRKVLIDFNLIHSIKPFTRCVECNAVLVRVNPEEVKGKVPEYVYKTSSEFRMCPNCKKIYWKGTHLDWIAKDMEKLVGEWKME